MIAAAGQAAEAAALTREAVLAAAAQYRNLPPHHADATKPDQAYRSDLTLQHIEIPCCLLQLAGCICEPHLRSFLNEASMTKLAEVPESAAHELKLHFLTMWS